MCLLLDFFCRGYHGTVYKMDILAVFVIRLMFWLSLDKIDFWPSLDKRDFWPSLDKMDFWQSLDKIGF